jgi:1,4-alpha-glucan branching enzyme
MKSTKAKFKSLSKTLLAKSAPVLEPLESGVALKLVAPAAREVCVAGTFNDWKTDATPLKAAVSGEWRGELKLSPGRYEYLFVVDGQWRPDPAANESTPNPFGGVNSVVSVV